METTLLLLGILSSSQEAEPSDRLFKLVETFVTGEGVESAAAQEELRRRGRDALPWLARARIHRKGAKRWGELTDLAHEIRKKTADTPTSKKANEWMDRRLEGLRCETGARTVVDFLRDVRFQPWAESGWTVSIVLDPILVAGVGGREVVADINAGPRSVLEAVIVQHDLDFDFRYGVIFVSTPERLWGAPEGDPIPALSPQREPAVREWVEQMGNGNDLEARDRAYQRLWEAGPSVVPVLRQGLKSADPEISARCEDLFKKVGPWKGLRRENGWRSQRIEDQDRWIADRLREREVTTLLEHGFVSMKGLLALLEKETGVPVRALPADFADRPVPCEVMDVPLANVVELLTLPWGLDAWIERGAVVIREPDPK